MRTKLVLADNVQWSEEQIDVAIKQARVLQIYVMLLNVLAAYDACSESGLPG